MYYYTCIHITIYALISVRVHMHPYRYISPYICMCAYASISIYAIHLIADVHITRCGYIDPFDRLFCKRALWKRLYSAKRPILWKSLLIVATPYHSMWATLIHLIVDTRMGWLWLVCSLKLHVSFAKESYKRDYILQKRPIIWRSLLIVATTHHSMWCTSYITYINHHHITYYLVPAHIMYTYTISTYNVHVHYFHI